MGKISCFSLKTKFQSDTFLELNANVKMFDQWDSSVYMVAREPGREPRTPEMMQ